MATLKECLESGKRFRTSGTTPEAIGDWCEVRHGRLYVEGELYSECSNVFSVQDVEAEWEIEQETVTITRAELSHALNIRQWVSGYRSEPLNILHINEIAKELGFKD